ncbi:hypothetical protein LTR33_007807, partial [Friedmanniomyces endolithicus]
VSSENTPFQTEEAWVDSVAEANAAVSEEQHHQQNPTGGEPDTTAPTASDPTLANAGLTELDAPQTNGFPATNHELLTTPANASAGDEAGNLAGDRWDTGAGAQQDAMGGDDGYEIIPRPNDEVDIPASSSGAAPVAAAAPAVEDMLQREKTSWADEANASATPAEPASTSGMDSGNAAAESWDSKPAGQTQDTAIPNNNDSDPLVVAAGEIEAGGPGANDGFQAVGGRGGGRGGRGDFFNRGGRGGDRGGGRGRGDFRGRGRGSFNRGGERGGRGGGGEGGDRGRGGRGRGMRGDGGPTRGDGAPRGDAGPVRG